MPSEQDSDEEKEAVMATGKRGKNKKATDKERELYHLWGSAASAVTVGLERALNEYELTLSQFLVLDFIEQRGETHQLVLAELLNQTPGNITMVMKNLDRANLVKRQKSKHDRRFRRVTLTPRGRKKLEEARPVFAQIVKKIFGSLGAADLSRLVKSLEKISTTARNL
ncbi:MAG: MarR family transcriptional regulator [Candidatus Hydrogenedentota bacterium]|nr:MAG: MarR family transcriptional regulator [Candidatus Hydrogenedentota bacterium]